jgi:ADP-ribosyl-[dinitrogen reductase] hydrolase
MTTHLHRFQGCLLGLAVGDALGTTVEFSPPGTFEPMTDIVGGGPFRLPAGHWTDDTSMALCLAESLIENGWDLKDQMDRYVRWWKKGYNSSTGRCFDIGGTVMSALSRYRGTGDPVAGSTDPYSAGNGSLMRLAPVPMCYAADLAEAVRKSGESSIPTHGATTCVDACRYFGGLVASALHGAAKDDLLAPDYLGKYMAAGELCPEINAIARGSFKEKHPPQIRGTGYVVESLEAALWAFHNSASFEEGCLLAVNLGDDADTTGAIYGQIAGAFYGLEGIPQKWRAKVHQHDRILQLAEELFGAAGQIAGQASRNPEEGTPAEDSAGTG